jgi:hypothetical protein
LLFHEWGKVDVVWGVVMVNGAGTYVGGSGRGLEFELLVLVFLVLYPMLEPELMHPIMVLAVHDYPFL